MALTKAVPATTPLRDQCTPWRALTRRQRDVLALISEGKSNKLIAGALNMSESTVKAHVKQIIRRLNVANRTQAALLATDPALVKAWAAGEPSSFDPTRDLEPLLAAGMPLSPTLPVSVFTDYLAAEAPERARAHVRAIASLYQTNLEVERDGDRLQELFRFYIGVGLPVYVGQLRLPGRVVRRGDGPVGAAAGGGGG